MNRGIAYLVIVGFAFTWRNNATYDVAVQRFICKMFTTIARDRIIRWQMNGIVRIAIGLMHCRGEFVIFAVIKFGRLVM